MIDEREREREISARGLGEEEIIMEATVETNMEINDKSKPREEE